MSLVGKIQEVLDNAAEVSVEIGAGRYPDLIGICGKIVFTGAEKPIGFLGGEQLGVETFKVVLRGEDDGDDYEALEQIAGKIKAALQNEEFIQIGGYEDIEPKEDENFMQLAVSFKTIKNY